MGVPTRGFHGRETDSAHKLPPGQYETRGFPVLSAGPTPRIPLDRWQFTIATETLRLLGYEVHTARNATEALAL